MQGKSQNFVAFAIIMLVGAFLDSRHYLVCSNSFIDRRIKPGPVNQLFLSYWGMFSFEIIQLQDVIPKFFFSQIGLHFIQ